MRAGPLTPNDGVHYATDAIEEGLISTTGREG